MSTVQQSHVVHVTPDTFDAEVLQHKAIVLVDFWADRCGPCKMIAPALESLASDFAGRVKIAKLDVAAWPDAATTYGIDAIPAVLAFRDGEVIDRLVGAHPRSRYEQLLARHGVEPQSTI